MTGCLGCGVPVELDRDAYAWTKRAVYYDPEVLDVDNNGLTCADGGVHEVGPVTVPS